MKILILVLILVAATGCNKSYCPQTVKISAGLALQACMIAAEQMQPEDLLGKTPVEWCGEVDDLTPMYVDYVQSLCIKTETEAENSADDD